MTTATLEQRVEKLETDIIPRKEFENDLATMKTLGKLFGEGVDTLLETIKRVEKNLDKKIDIVEKGLNQKIDTVDKKIDILEKSLTQKIDTVVDSITSLKWFVVITLVITGVGFSFLTLVLSIGFGFFGK